jgi:hypothetical protein
VLSRPRHSAFVDLTGSRQYGRRYPEFASWAHPERIFIRLKRWLGAETVKTLVF